MSDGIETKILGCLRKSAPKDMSIDEIAKATRTHPNTVSKYVFALEKEGKIKMARTVGNAKMYTVED